MAFATANRVKDYTATSGTGTITLATTPPTGFNQFNGAIASGSTCHYCIVDGGNYEIGLGTFTEPNQLARTTPLETKVSGIIDTTSPAAITLSGSSAEVFIVDVATTESFTPTVIGTTSAGAGTYSVQQGSYSISGKTVSFSIRLTWSAHTGTGNYTIGTLPALPVQATPCSLYIGAVTFTGVPTALVNTTGVISIHNQVSNTAVAALAMDTDYTVTPQVMYLSGSYQIA